MLTINVNDLPDVRGHLTSEMEKINKNSKKKKKSVLQMTLCDIFYFKMLELKFIIFELALDLAEKIFSDINDGKMP